MQDFFEIYRLVANTDTTKYTIKDLTILIANKAGYHRDYVTQKNGKTRLRTLYDRPFDDVLISKWIMYFEPMMQGKFHKHPELDMYKTDIIQRTIQIFFNALQIDKIITDSSVTRCVNICFIGRIGEALWVQGSNARLDRLINKDMIKNHGYSEKSFEEGTVAKHNNVTRQTDILLTTAVSLDQAYEDYKILPTGTDGRLYSDEVLIDEIRKKLKDNKYGLKLLDIMLNYNDYKFASKDIKSKYFNPLNPKDIASHLRFKLDLSEERKNYINNKLDEAYKIIVTTLMESLPKDVSDKYDWKKRIKDVKFKINNDKTFLSEINNEIKKCAKIYNFNKDEIELFKTYCRDIKNQHMSRNAIIKNINVMANKFNKQLIESKQTV